VILLLLALTSGADEGMWLPEQLPEIGPAWAERGLQIAPERLADPLGDPLGAVVSLGFCSASFVSPDGLMATNHHCVESYLQYNSSAERNLHVDGFVAGSRADELSTGPTGRVWVVERIEDVTATVLAGIGRRGKDATRERKVSEASKRLVAACERQPNRRCRVASFRGGGEFRLITSREILDVRLVAAPSMALGQFGGDIDNWMWPRHSADFAFVRAYVAPDGSSAPYAKDNVPYQPPHHLVVDPTGAEPGSFVMVAGYPGRTERHARARELRWYAEQYVPTDVALTAAVMATLQQHADADADAAAKVGASISQLGNGLKNDQGLLDGLSHGDLIAQKEATEAEILAWIDADPARRKRWAAGMREHAALIDAEQADALRAQYVSWIRRGADLLGVANRALRLAQERRKPDIQRDGGYQDRDVERIQAGLERLDKSLHLPSDRAVLGLVLARYVALPEGERVAELDAWLQAHGGVDAALDDLYAGPALSTTAGRLALLDQDLATLEASRDPWMQLAVALDAWSAPRRAVAKERAGAHLRLDPLWYAALEAWETEHGRVLYDDANGTLRLTLGHVAGYEPEDGLWAKPQTTVSGLAAKAGGAPFDIDAATVARAKQGGGRWKDEALGDGPADFLTTLDTTGGNSGSAVLDGEGRFVGLAFDGNYESIAADWIFLPEVTRTICIDVRYMGWVMDGWDGAGWIREEIGL
jgi:hypothetical protein